MFKMKLKMNIIACSMLVATTLTSANVVAESLADQIKKRAGVIGEVKALLNNSDPSIRIAALDTMLKSNDTAMRETAYSMGLNSADDTLRAIALRNKFNELKVMHIAISLPEGADEKVKKVFNDYGGALSLNIKSYDEKTGRFVFNTRFVNGKDGNVSGLALQFESKYCQANMAFNEESVYSGSMTCEKTIFPVTFSIM
jgi:hypothetical protein